MKLEWWLVVALTLAAMPAEGYVARTQRDRPFLRYPGRAPAGAMEVSPMLGVSNESGFEIGAKAGKRFFNPGFLPRLNNSVSFEAGAFTNGLLGQRNLYLLPLMRWDFHLHEQWTVYGAGGVEIELSGSGLLPVAYVHVSHSLAAGAFLRLNPKFDLRGEVDLGHSTVRVGPSWRF